jgi:hypothetical protein
MNAPRGILRCWCAAPPARRSRDPLVERIRLDRANAAIRLRAWKTAERASGSRSTLSYGRNRHALHHPSHTAQDVANVVMAAWSQGAEDDGRDYREALLEACSTSRQVWRQQTAGASRSPSSVPCVGGGSRYGALVIRRPGRLWRERRGPELCHAVDRRRDAQVFGHLENHVSSEKSWALKLMREVGFAVQPDLPDAGRRPSPSCMDRRRWASARQMAQKPTPPSTALARGARQHRGRDEGSGYPGHSAS